MQRKNAMMRRWKKMTTTKNLKKEINEPFFETIFIYIKKLYDTYSREQKVRLLKRFCFPCFQPSISQKQIIEHFSPDFAF